MFRPEFIRAHQQSKSTLPISVWKEVVGKHLPQFQSDEDIYRPVSVNIAIAGNLNLPQFVRIQVPATTDPNWYQKLVSAVEEMTKTKGIKIQTYTGKPIENMTVGQLFNCGECEVVKCGRGAANISLRTPSVVPPPAHMSTNKLAYIRRWWTESIKDKLIKSVSEKLKGLSMPEIEELVKPGGVVQKHVESVISPGFQELVETYGNGRATLESVSSPILMQIREALVHNEEHVTAFHAHKKLGSNSALWKTSNVAGAAKMRYKDDLTLYKEITEDAINHPITEANVIGAVSRGSSSRGKTSLKGPIGRKKKTHVINSYHPVDAFYRNHYYQVAGSIPTHILEQYNKNSLAKYPGDIQETLNMFNVLTGRSIDCGVCGKKKKSKPVKGQMVPIQCSSCQENHSHMPPLVPIKGSLEMPPLVPIKGSVPPLVPIKGSLEMPPLVPIKGSLEMPPLVPIRSSVKPKERELPPLVPIRSSLKTKERELPPLVPIRSSAGINKKYTDDLPNLEDFLKK